MAILKSLIVKGVSRFLTDAYMSTIRSGIWNGSIIQVGYGGTGVDSAKGDLYTPVFLSSSGITPCSTAIPHNTKDFKINGTTYSIFTTYTGTAPTIFAPTALAGTGGYILATNSAKTGLEWVAANNHSHSLYVKLDAGAAEQTIKNSISSLANGSIEIWRATATGYAMIGFANGETKTKLGMLGFTTADTPVFRSTTASYYTLAHAGNIVNNTTTVALNTEATIATIAGVAIKLKVTGSNNRRAFYGTCSTAAATAAKEVTLSSTAGWELVAGTIVGIKFTNSNSASSVTLNVNSTGAKSIYYSGAVYTGSSIDVCGTASRVTYYMYDGTNWAWLGSGYIINTTYSAMSLDEMTTGTATTARLITAKVLNDWLHTKNHKVTGQWHFNTNTNAAPVIISRSGSSTEAMNIGVTDGETIFQYTNDEYSSSIIFRLINADTESSDGSRASNRNVTISSNNSAINMYIGGSLVAHAGNIRQSASPVVLSSYNTEYTIATIAGKDIKIKTPPDSHYTSHLYVGEQNATSSSSQKNPYLILCDNSTIRNQYQIKGDDVSIQVKSDSSGNIKTKLGLLLCRGGSSPSNSGLWSTIKNGITNSQTNSVRFYTIYEDGGPVTYGDMMEILSCSANHWQPQLFFGGGKGSHMYYRNKTHNDDTWGSWLTILDTGNVSPVILNGTASNTVRIKVGEVASSDYTIPYASDADKVDGDHASMWFKAGRAYPEGKSDKPYHLVAQYVLNDNTSTLVNTTIALFVRRYYDSTVKQSGILIIRAHYESGSSTPEFYHASWSLNNGISTSDFIITHKTISNTTTLRLYIKATGWTSYGIRKMEEGSWSHRDDIWTLYDARNSNAYSMASIPSDETQINSSLVDISNNAATASKWYTARNFTIGNSTQSVNGSQNITWTLANIGASSTSHTHSVKINGSTKTIAASGGTAVDLGSYLPLSGGTMTGAIKRYYPEASDDPMIALTSYNQDVWLWRINHGSSAATTATSAVSGFGLKYLGTGNGVNNSLALYADNLNETQVAAVIVNLAGLISLASGNIVNDNVTVPLNTEKTVATICGVPIKLKVTGTNNVSTTAVVSSSATGTSQITTAQSNPYYNLLEGGSVTRSIRFLAGSNISISAATNGQITFTNTGVRSVTINGNYLRVNTNGTNADLTIPYATATSVLNSKGISTETAITQSGVRAYTGNGPSWEGNIITMKYAAILTFGDPSRGWQMWAARTASLDGGGMSWRRGNSDATAWEDPRLFLDSVNTSASVSSNTLTLTIGGNTTTFTPTFSDTKVTQNSATGDANYRVLFKYTANDTNETNTVRYSTKMYYNPSKGLLYNNGNVQATGYGYFGENTRIFGLVATTTLQSSYGLSSSWTASSGSREDWLKAWCKYVQTNHPGLAVLSTIKPSSIGYIQAHAYNSGFITLANIDSGGNYTNAELGAPVHINGRYYDHGGTEQVFGYSFGKWYFYTGLHSGNSSVSGGGSTWGSSITVKINNTSKTLTIPQFSSLVEEIYSGSVSTSSEAWTDVISDVSTKAAGTYAIQIQLTNGANSNVKYASGIFSLCASTDAINDEIPLHVSGTDTSWRPYAKINGKKLQMSSSDATATTRSYKIKIIKLI